MLRRARLQCIQTCARRTRTPCRTCSPPAANNRRRGGASDAPHSPPPSVATSVQDALPASTCRLLLLRPTHHPTTTTLVCLLTPPCKPKPAPAPGNVHAYCGAPSARETRREPSRPRAEVSERAKRPSIHANPGGPGRSIGWRRTGPGGGILGFVWMPRPAPPATIWPWGGSTPRPVRTASCTSHGLGCAPVQVGRPPRSLPRAFVTGRLPHASVQSPGET
eukprot:scaffold2828_cov352-Prasinococcus_capsulatus_cf.AAC.1